MKRPRMDVNLEELDQIIERGTHNELLAQHGFYYNLYMSQFRHDEEPEAVAAPSGNGHKAGQVATA